MDCSLAVKNFLYGITVIAWKLIAVSFSRWEYVSFNPLTPTQHDRVAQK